MTRINAWIRAFKLVEEQPMRRRRGLATLDYILVLCVCLPMVAFTLWAGPRIMNLVYQMTCVLVSWPFM